MEGRGVRRGKRGWWRRWRLVVGASNAHATHLGDALARDAEGRNLLERHPRQQLHRAVGEAGGQQLAVGREGEAVAQQLVEHPHQEETLLGVVPQLKEARVAAAREPREERVGGEPVHRRVLPLHEQRAAPRIGRALLEHRGGAADDEGVGGADDKVGARERRRVAQLLEGAGLVRERERGDRPGVQVLKPRDDPEVEIVDADVAVGARRDDQLAAHFQRVDRARVQLHQLDGAAVGGGDLGEIDAVPEHGVAVGGGGDGLARARDEGRRRQRAHLSGGGEG